MSVEECSWMYQGWKDNGCHSQEWVRNTNAFLDRAFRDVRNSEKFGVVCPCSDCGNRVRRRRAVMGMHLCKRGFMPGYTLWTEHGEHPVSERTLQHAYSTVDGLDEMLADFGDAMHTENLEDEPAADAKAFYAMLSASKEPLHNLTSVARLTAVARLMAIKSQHSLSMECINKLLNLFDDVLPENHKMPKTLYECQYLLRGLKMPYVKIDACINNCMIYYKEDANYEKCDFCEESRYVVVEATNQGHKRKPIALRFCRKDLDSIQLKKMSPKNMLVLPARNSYIASCIMQELLLQWIIFG